MELKSYEIALMSQHSAASLLFSYQYIYFSLYRLVTWSKENPPFPTTDIGWPTVRSKDICVKRSPGNIQNQLQLYRNYHIINIHYHITQPRFELHCIVIKHLHRDSQRKTVKIMMNACIFWAHISKRCCKDLLKYWRVHTEWIFAWIVGQCL